ncbi:TetR/AcrR family transcriptional regulator [Parafrigoribacterium soli]|uniref:TetR/AcrR family transcriptional regulator n=1 Tax=Parafrigoribacterium soli TaxID=3144663 RepID=UPI0032EAE697
MPTPERTSAGEILSAARSILEADGLSALTMAAVAARVGIRAPSLYKRVGSRDELVGLVAEATVQDLAELLDRGAEDLSNPAETVATLARSLRAFASERPAAYHLIFAPGPGAARPRVETLTRATAVLIRVTERMVGPDEALEAARLLTAWIHGFVSMELRGAFRMGGDVDRAFDYGLARLVASLEPSALEPSARDRPAD